MMLFMDAELTDSAKHTALRPLRCAMYVRVSVEDKQDAQMSVLASS